MTVHGHLKGRTRASEFLFVLLLYLIHSPTSVASTTAVSERITQAQARQASGEFAAAQALLEAVLNQTDLTSDDTQHIFHALADLHYAWGDSLRKRYAYQDAIPHYQAAIDLNRKERPKEAAATLMALGEVYDDLAQYDTAREYYEQALTLQRQIGDRRGEATTLNLIGKVHCELSLYLKANEYLEQALTIMRNLGDRRGEGKALDNLGEVSLELSRYEQGRSYFEQALRIAQEGQQKEDEAETLRNLGAAAQILNQHDVALRYLEQALGLSRAILDRRGEARALNGLGMLHRSLSHYEQAIRVLEQALVISREVHDRETASACLGNLGNAYHSLSLNDRAKEYYEQALSMTREVKNRSGEGVILGNLGNAYLSLSQADKAIEYFQSSLAIAREVKNRNDEGRSLTKLGLAYFQVSQYEKAITNQELALTIARETKDRELESAALNNLGLAHRGLGHYEQALTYYEQALVIDRETQDRTGEGRTLVSLGDVAIELSQYERAITYLEPALALTHKVKDREAEAHALGNLGSAYNGMIRYEKATEYWELALAMLREVKHRFGEGRALNNLGLAYGALGQYEKAIGYFEQSLVIRREVKDRVGEGTVLTNLGGAYFSLGQHQQAAAYFEQGLAIAREVKDRSGEGRILNNLGIVSQQQGQHEKAVAYYEQALALAREVKNQANEGTILDNLAMVYVDLGEQERGKTYLEQARAIMREIKNRDGESNVLSNLGSAYFSVGQYAQAIAYEESSLTIAREVKNPTREGTLLSNLMAAWQKRGNSALAIFYGKQAVNIYQRIRSNIRGLSTELQQNYVHSEEITYRVLADLLISEGRLPEAEQVLNLLKAEEYLDFVRRDAKVADGMKGSATLTSTETDWARRYREIADRVTAIGVEWRALREKENPSPAEVQQLTQLEDDLGVAKQAFDHFLSQLATEFDKTPETTKEIADLPEKTQGLMSDLHELGPGVVALYTLVSAQTYRVLLITADTRVAREYSITAADLNRKVHAFREVLQQPQRDPRPLAQELYHILIGPVARDLELAQAQTLMWTLDGVLRYVPIAALHDGKRYLVERYRNVMVTPASQTRLKDLPQRQWTGLGLGVTLPHGDFAALPAVGLELHGIIRESKGDAEGVLWGAVKMDSDFTEASMRSALRQHYGAVHLASHFKLTPGNDTASFLLLGDGNSLSLARLNTLPNVFEGVELLALSACNTAFGGGTEADGKEVESFGVMAQKQGAKAVIASLWPVADVSTKELMQTFYRIRESKKGMTKAEALRQAQLVLLRGKITQSDTAQQRGVVQVSHDAPNGDEHSTATPQFVKDPAAPYAHPYYWAPFILIGNWQ